jgi:hypothetical protein
VIDCPDVHDSNLSGPVHMTPVVALPRFLPAFSENAFCWTAPAKVATRCGLEPTKPYQRSRICSTCGARMSPARRSAAVSSSDHSTVALSRSSSSVETGLVASAGSWKR